jgi:hypothetical protein
MPAMASPGHGFESKHLLGIIDSIPSLIHTGRPDGYLDYFNPLGPYGAMVSRIFVSWNQIDGWLRQVEGLRRVL